MSVREILERACRLADESPIDYTSYSHMRDAVDSALAALEAEGTGRPTWWQLRKMIMDTADASVGKDYEHRSAEAEALANWIEQRYGVQPAIPLPGQSPEPSAGLRDVFDEFRDALRPLRADEEQSDGQ